MKHILFIIGLISFTLIACAQQTPYADLPVKSTSAGADGHTIVSAGEPYKMTTSVLLSDVNDSLAVHLDSLQIHNDRLKAVEAGGGSSYTAGRGLTLDVTEFDLGGTLDADVIFTGSTSYDFEIGTPANNIKDFRVYGDSEAWIESEGIYLYAAISAVTPTINLSINDGGKTFTMNPTSMLVTDNDDSKGLENSADYSANWTDHSLVTKKWVTDNFGVSSTQVSYTTCADNTTTNITIGTTSDVSFVLHYVAERDMGTVQKVTGNIDVIYDDVSTVVSYFPDQIPSTGVIDLGLTITADESGGNIRLNIAVDNTNTNDLSFDYSIVHKFYE